MNSFKPEDASAVIQMQPIVLAKTNIAIKHTFWSSNVKNKFDLYLSFVTKFK